MCFVRLGFIGGDGLWIPLKSSCVAERAYKRNRKSLFACQRLLNIFFSDWVLRGVRVLLLLLSTVSILIELLFLETVLEKQWMRTAQSGVGRILCCGSVV